MSASVLTAVSMTEVQGCLVVVMQGDIQEEAFNAVYQTVSARLAEKRLPGTIFDFSGVHLMDLHEFDRIKALARVIGFLGARVVFVALKPGIASFLAQADTDIGDLQFCLQIEDAFALLARQDER